MWVSRQIVMSYFWMLSLFWCLTFHFKTVCVSIRSKIYDPQGLFPWNSMDHINTKPPQATSKKVKTEICTLGQCNLNKNEKGFRLQRLRYILIRLHGGAPCSKIWKKWNFREFLPHRSKSIFVYFLLWRVKKKFQKNIYLSLCVTSNHF